MVLLCFALWYVLRGRRISYTLRNSSESLVEATWAPMKSTIFMSLSMIASVLAVAIGLGLAYFNKWHHLVINENIETYKCLRKHFVPMILSTDPLLIHIDEFVTPFEAEYLISLA